MTTLAILARDHLPLSYCVLLWWNTTDSITIQDQTNRDIINKVVCLKIIRGSHLIYFELLDARVICSNSHENIFISPMEHMIWPADIVDVSDVLNDS